MWTALAKIAQESGPEARRRPRFRANDMFVDHGMVTDFSATGLRIAYKRRPKFKVGKVVDLTLQNPQGERHCRAEVMWVRKDKKTRLTDVGLRFVDEKTAEQMQLFRAAYNSLNDGKWSNE